MARATEQQVQDFVNARVRPRAEAMRALVEMMTDDTIAIDSVYQHCNDNPTWVDNREDVPNQLTPSNVLAYNAFAAAFRDWFAAREDKNLILSFCVRPSDGG